MTRTEAKTHNLFFPQQQGSSLTDAEGLAEGATRLRKLFPHRTFVTPEVHPERASQTVAGIRSRDVLASQLTSARRTLESASPERILTLGGDCSVDLAPVGYLNERYDDLAVLWLDAHPDLNTPQSSPSGALHGMVLRHLLGEGDRALLAQLGRPLEPRQVFLAGVRDFDPPERDYVESRDIWHVGVADLELRPERLIETVTARGFSKVHLHFDLDVLDPKVFAAMSHPTPSGLSLVGATRLLALLGTSFEVVGVTLTEYLPQPGGDAGEQAVLETLVRSLPDL